jgi:hypothetical protein
MKFETKSRRRAMKCARPPDETNDVTLRRQLLQAGQANVDPWADISPIRALLEQGCGLEADVARARRLPPDWTPETSSALPSARRSARLRDTPGTCAPATGACAPGASRRPG